VSERQQFINLNFSNGFPIGKLAVTQGLVSFSATRWHCWCILVNLL